MDHVDPAGFSQSSCFPTEQAWREIVWREPV